ncbi:hypothetical protein [Candidatus Enterovibrio escicola]|uniref:hypothetical protein n=1 Tax=Candidatus Enterovibrio escicola TaxID=1927127 RepID=UPI0016812EF4|nr:hypothetical protein [Candidatus Enterovibrio escacola]
MWWLQYDFISKIAVFMTVPLCINHIYSWGITGCDFNYLRYAFSSTFREMFP